MDGSITEKLLAESGIRELQGRYVDAVWRKDLTAFADCFTAEAEWRIVGHILRGPEECTNALKTFTQAYDRIRMVLQSPLIEVTGDTATARTDVIEHNMVRSGSRMMVVGRYYDRVARQQDNKWRFTWHYYQLYYLGSPDMSGRFYDQKDFGPPFSMPPLDEPTAPLD
jgi:uncharacterized protein (TIGR02246 family)